MNHLRKRNMKKITFEQLKKLVKEGIEPDEPEVLTWRVFNKETGEEMANGTVEAKSTDIEAECKKWEDTLVYLYGDDVEAQVTRTLKRYLESKDVPEVHLEIDHKRDANGWATGYIGVGDNCYEVQMKYFDKPSRFGIKGGRVSKLWVADEDTKEEILSYDRGWDVRPQDPESKAILKAILKEFN